jgi:hypothetical protein
VVSMDPMVPGLPAVPVAPGLSKESIPMPETAVRRRVRHASRTSESDRKNAAAALQRALDRRDNGGSTGH